MPADACMPQRRKGALQPLPVDAPEGTRVLVVEDDKTITRTVTRSAPWKLPNGRMVVLLKGRAGGFAAERCHLDTMEVPDAG